jgi:uncharacterized SAM-binding protein YcdF (DUF218 family)
VKKSTIIQAGLLIIAIAAIIDTFIMFNRSGSMDTGILLPSVAGVCIIFGIIFIKTKIYKKNSKFYNSIAKVVLVLFLVWLVSFVVLLTVIFTSAVSQKDEKVDSVIVLGAGLKGDVPTLALKSRLDAAIDYLNNNPEAKAVVSGGQGYGEKISEAEGMRRYLVSHGVPGDRILKEENSTSTYENMLYSKKVYESSTGKKLGKVMIITNNFHMMRSKMLAKRAGLEPYGISSSTPWYIYPNVLLREYLAVFKSFVFDR